MTRILHIDGLSAWIPGDFASEANWSFDLTDAERATIVELGAGHAGPGIDALTERARGWADALASGSGFVRIRRFPVDRLDGEQLERAYLEFGRLLGTPVGQDRQGSLVTHIRDERLPPGPGVRRYQTNLSQDFHSDASDVVGLLCIRPSMSGGMSRIVSAHTVYNELARRSPELLELLYAPMPWSRHTEQREGESPYFELAPMDVVNGVPRISVIPWFIRQSQAHPSAPRLTTDQLAALDLLESIPHDPQLQIMMEFEPGDIQWLNNTSILHARDEYDDFDDPELRRYLIRLWLTADVPVAEEILRGGRA